MLVQFMVETHGVSRAQVRKTLSVLRNTFQYHLKPKKRYAGNPGAGELVAKHPSIGCWQSHYRLGSKGHL